MGRVPDLCSNDAGIVTVADVVVVDAGETAKPPSVKIVLPENPFPDNVRVVLELPAVTRAGEMLVKIGTGF